MLTHGEEALYRKMSNHKEIAKGENSSENGVALYKKGVVSREVRGMSK